MSTFSSLGIRKDYIKSIKEIGISKPTEIQEKTIPTLIKSKTDFIGLAQRGTGKTAAFGLPILHHIDAKSENIQALILSPTRELVQQIKKQLFKFTKYVDERIFLEAVFGGEKIDRQINNLKRTTHVKNWSAILHSHHSPSRKTLTISYSIYMKKDRRIKLTW